MTPQKHTQDATAAPAEAVTFALERFAWAAPDRLELAGTFDGLGAAPPGAAVLVLTGPTGTYRLTASPGDVAAPVNGEPWLAVFVWHEAPAAFDAAVLELGDDLAVDLPVPGADASQDALAMRFSANDDAAGPAARVAAEADRLGLWEDLTQAQQEARRVGEELERARADLATEREGRAEDAARFRAGLAEMREATESALGEQAEALSSAHAEAERLRGELATAQAEADDARRRIATVREALQLPDPVADGG
jgi:hypothetical protein